MKTPRLNRRMIHERRSEVPNGAGGLVVTWQELGAQWVAVEAGGGRQAGSEGLHLGQVPLRLILRAAPVGDVARPRPGQRFREGGRVFQVIAVAEADPDQRYLTCFAKEEVPQ